MKARSIYAPVLVGAALALAACVRQPPAREIAPSKDFVGADLYNAAGSGVVFSQLKQESGGVTVRLEANGLTPGSYAAHVHAVGRCDEPDFTTAGGHWNPGGRQHGRDNPAGAHRGDLPNLAVDATGKGSVTFLITGARLRGGGEPLLDNDGAALVVHASPDDYRTDPSGNSGARIACGIIEDRAIRR